MKRALPLLDDGMIALLQRLEETESLSLQDLHEKCLATKGDFSLIYKKRSKRNVIDIQHYGSPVILNGRMTIVATISGQEWIITSNMISIEARIMPATLQEYFCNIEKPIKATDIIDHPYLVGALITKGIKDKNSILLEVQRDT